MEQGQTKSLEYRLLDFQTFLDRDIYRVEHAISEYSDSGVNEAITKAIDECSKKLKLYKSLKNKFYELFPELKSLVVQTR